MDPRMTQQPFPAGAVPGASPDARQKRLTRIAEEIPPGDGYSQYQNHNNHMQDVSDGEARAEEPASHPSKRQRMTHTCDICGTSYTEKRALARHRHTDQHRHRMGLPPLKKYECSVCGTQFSRRHDRLRHENERHGGPKSGSPCDIGVAGGGVAGVKGSRRPTPPVSDVDHVFQPHGRTPTSDTEESSSGVPTVGSSVDDDRLYQDPPAPPAFYQGSSTPESVTSQTYRQHASHYTAAPYTPQSMDSAVLGMENVIFENTIYDPSEISVSRHILDSMTEEMTSDGETSRHDSAIDMGSSRKPSEVSQAGSDYGSIDNHAPLHRTRSFESPSLPPLTSHKKTSLINRHGQLRAISTRAADMPTFCVICGSPFEEQQDDLLSHLRRHLDELQSVHSCDECRVGFVHAQDLHRHLTSARLGDCGFSFPHIRPCTGHHPPGSDDPNTGLSDRDSFQLSVKLKHWEQSQLHAYMTQINDLIASRNGKAKPDHRRGSIVSLDYLTRSRPASLYSSAGASVRTYDTAPVDRSTNTGESDIGGLARRFRNMAFVRNKGSSSHDPATTVAGWHSGGGGGGGGNANISRKVSAASAQLNKSLRKAIYRCALDRVEKLLALGADPGVLNGDDAMLTIMALWDRASAQALIVQHTIGQQCYGARCGCALSRPTESRDPDLIRALLDHGANANDAGGLCGLPLHTAAYMGKPEVVRILLEYGANLNARAGKYGSALCCAAARAELPGNVEVVRLLIESGADPHARSGPEGTAIALASRRHDLCSMETIGADNGRPEVSAKINCCDEVLRIFGVGE